MFQVGLSDPKSSIPVSPALTALQPTITVSQTGALTLSSFSPTQNCRNTIFVPGNTENNGFNSNSSISFWFSTSARGSLSSQEVFPFQWRKGWGALVENCGKSLGFIKKIENLVINISSRLPTRTVSLCADSYDLHNIDLFLNKVSTMGPNYRHLLLEIKEWIHYWG